MIDNYKVGSTTYFELRRRTKCGIPPAGVAGVEFLLVLAVMQVLTTLYGGFSKNKSKILTIQMK